MENVKITKNSKVYGFRVGDEFPVLRNIMGKCVVVRGEFVPNNVLSERKLCSYGALTGSPVLGGI